MWLFLSNFEGVCRTEAFDEMARSNVELVLIVLQMREGGKRGRGEKGVEDSPPFYNELGQYICKLRVDRIGRDCAGGKVRYINFGVLFGKEFAFIGLGICYCPANYHKLPSGRYVATLQALFETFVVDGVEPGGYLGSGGWGGGGEGWGGRGLEDWGAE